MGQLTGPVLVTGASGALGRRVVAALLARNLPVRGLYRSAPPVAPRGVEVVTGDLCDGAGAAVDGASAVIHLAAAMGGSEADHARDTIAATRALLAALAAEPMKKRVVLAGSVAVYRAHRPRNATFPGQIEALETRPATRDAYARAKLEQERLVREASQRGEIAATILRIGALEGNARVLAAHLGLRLGPVFLRLSARGKLPLADPGKTARRLADAATLPADAGTEIAACVHRAPDRSDIAAQLAARGDLPRATLPLDWRILLPFAHLADATGFWPSRPALLRGGALRARFGDWSDPVTP